MNAETLLEPCEYCGAPSGQPCDFYCVASPTEGGRTIDLAPHDQTVSFGHGVIVVHFDLAMTSRVFDNGSLAAGFRGETAWSDAERFAYDLALQYMIEAGK